MAYNFINDTQASTDGSTGTSMPASAIAVAQGNLLVFASRYANATAVTTTISDNVGGNVYVPIATYFNSVNGAGCAFFYALNSAAGNTTFTSNYSATCTNRAIYAGQYAGLTNLITANGQENESPGTGADAYTSGNVSVGSFPAMAWGFIAEIHNYNQAPAAGTGYTGRTPSWNESGATFFALAEDKRIIAPGNYAATFTVAEGSGRYVLIAVFQEVIQQQITSSGVFVTP
jgi:hypothetical protein